MTISMRDALTQVGAKALIGIGTRVEAWASEPNEESFPSPVGTSVDATFFTDDIGWIPAAMDEAAQYGTGGDPRPMDRIKRVLRARLYYELDAMAKQAIRLHTVYCVGRGLSIKARDYKNNNPNVAGDASPDMEPGVDTADQLDNDAVQLQKEADRFWEHPENDSVFSVEAQAIHSDRLNVDGELFYILIPPTGEFDPFGTDEEVTHVRALTNCLQITRILKNPQDDSDVWYYLRTWYEKGEEKRALYPNYKLFFRKRADDGTLTLPPLGRMIDKGDFATVYGGELDGVKVIKDQFIFHQKVNTISDRGNSLLTPALDWTKVNRQYLEDRATISRAHAKFAWKRMIKGPASSVANFGRKTLSGQNAVSGAPVPSAAAQTLNVNSAMDFEPVNAQEGGKNAYIESRNFRLMFYAAVGFAEHYFGDGSNGTRATSVTMERPTELMLQAYQHTLKSGYEIMFAFHLTAIGREYDAHAVWVDAPPILEDDLGATINAILSVIGVLPQFDIDEIILKMLNAFQIDDPQDVLVKIRARQREIYNQNLQIAAIQAGLTAAQQGVAGADPAADPAGHIAAQGNLIAAQGKFMQMVTPALDPTKQPGPKVGPQFAQPGTKGGAFVMRKPTPPKLRPSSNAGPQ